MRMALTNLLQNAVQITPDEEKVVVDISQSRNDLVISVLDRGEGIAMENKEQIFEPFFTTRSGGMGLGLPVARRIVEMHGGSIEVANRSSGGAVFRIRLPKE